VNEDPAALLPELFLAASAIAGLLLGSWLPRRRQWPVRALAAAAAAAGIAATGVAFAHDPRVVFGTSYAVDAATNAARLVVLASLLLALALSSDDLAGDPRESEFFVLLQLGALGTIVLAGASDLLLLFAAYLLASVPLYALAGFRKDAAGTEAALKYYLLGALFGVTTIAGAAVLYGATRATAYGELASAVRSAPAGAAAIGAVALLAGLLFKSGAVPAHFWVPDVTEGSSTPAAAIVTTIPKVGGVIAIYRLSAVALPDAPTRWPLLLAIVAAASMTLGNLAAFFQTSVKRLLAYSTVSQVGYVLIAAVVARDGSLGERSLLFYLAAYAVTNLGAFAVVAALPYAHTLDDYRGLARRHPGLSAVLVLCLLGFVGTPPTAVFVGKLEVFSAAVEGGYAWLAVVAVLNTVASLFYYLRWLVPAVLSELPEGRADVLRCEGAWARGAAYAGGTAALLVGLAAGLLLPLLDGMLAR
jgi:NADH-quinone oxidoreductase subunit N